MVKTICSSDTFKNAAQTTNTTNLLHSIRDPISELAIFLLQVHKYPGNTYFLISYDISTHCTKSQVTKNDTKTQFLLPQVQDFSIRHHCKTPVSSLHFTPATFFNSKGPPFQQQTTEERKAQQRHKFFPFSSSPFLLPSTRVLPSDAGQRRC